MKPNENITSIQIKERLAIVCLYYAMLPSRSDTYKSCFKDLGLLSQKYNVNVNTLKNHKDAFDSQFSDLNKRRGWSCA